MKRLVDLFSGCGGFSLGAELSGYHTDIAIDIDKTLQSSFSSNFPKTTVLNDDVTHLTKAFWNRALQGRIIDGVIGGPPCQGFSRMGKREATDPRNSLVSHFFRQVLHINPKFFIMENVEGILDASNIDVLNAGMEIASRKYQILSPMVLNAADFGAATARKRVVIVGYSKDHSFKLTEKDFLPKKGQKNATVRDAIFDLPEPKSNEAKNDYSWGKYPATEKKKLSWYAERCRELPKKGLGWETAVSNLKNGKISGLSPTIHSEKVRRRFESIEQGESDRISKFPRLSWDAHCPTLRAGTGSEKGSFQSVRPIHPAKNRVITIREGARLQGFPDWFTFHPTKWHSFRMIGNSVCPLLSEHLHKTINRKLI